MTDQNQDKIETATEAATAPAPADIMELAEQADSATAVDKGPSPQPEAKQDIEEAANKPAPAAAESPSPDEPTNEKREGDRSPYAKAVDKAQKDNARLELSWKKVNEEKEAVRKEREQLARELEDRQRKKEDPGKAYDLLARKYKSEGRHDDAAAATRLAEQERRAAADQESFPKPDSHFEKPAFQKAWQGVRDQLFQEDPSLKDPSSEVVRIANGIIHSEDMGPIAKSSPAGLRAAVTVARIMVAARQAHERADEMSKRHEHQSKELSRLRSLTSVEGGGGSHQSARRSQDDMSESEREAYIRQAAFKADGH